MTNMFFEAPKKKEKEIPSVYILEALEKNENKKIDEWVMKGLVKEERVSELKKTLREAKMLKWSSADRVHLTSVEKAVLWDLIKNGKDKEAEELAKSYLISRKTGFIPLKTDVDEKEIINEAKGFRELSRPPQEGTKIVFTEEEKKLIGAGKPVKISEETKKEEEVKKAAETKRKSIKMSKKDVEEATETAKKIVKAIEEGDYETVEKLLPELKEGEKWFGGARGIWVDKRIAILQALYNELVENEKDKIKVDGIFGEQTLNAIKDMQRWAGLRGKSVDGYYDGETRAALLDWVKMLREERKSELVKSISPTIIKKIEEEKAKTANYKQMLFDALVAGGINKTDAAEIVNAVEGGDYNKAKELIEKNTRVVRTEVRQTSHREGPLVRKNVLDEEATKKNLMKLKESVKKVDEESELRDKVIVVINECLGIRETVGFTKKEIKESETTATFKSEEKKEQKPPVEPPKGTKEKNVEDEKDLEEIKKGKKKWGEKEKKEEDIPDL